MKQFLLPWFCTLTLCASAQLEPAPKAPQKAPDPISRNGLEPLPGEAPAKPYNLYGLVEYIEVPRDAWLAYAASQPAGIDSTTLRAEVQKWIAAGKAKPIELTCVPTKSGQRTVVESIIELRYPTQFYHTGPTPVPSTFETRNTHFSFQWEPVCHPNSRTLDSAVVPKICRLLGYNYHTPSERKAAAPGDVNQPLFFSLGTSVRVSSQANRPALIDVTTPYEDGGSIRDDVRWLIFFRGGPVPLTLSEKGASALTYEILDGDSRITMSQKEVDDLLNDRSQSPAAVRRRAAVRSQIEKPDGAFRALSVMFEIERLEVTLADLNTWFAAADLEVATGGLRKAALEWIQSGRGRAVDRRSGPAKFGQRSLLQTVLEVRYPTEFQYNPVVPSSFETRHAGDGIEFEPFLSHDGKIVDVSLTPFDVRHCGNAVVHRTEFEGKMVPDIEQPIFASMKTSTTLSTAVGQYTLLAINTPPNEKAQPDPQRRILTFIAFRP
jgi:hypothetical protein